MRKRMLSLLLFILLMALLFCVSAQAETAGNGRELPENLEDWYYWNYPLNDGIYCDLNKDGTLSIGGYGDMLMRPVTHNASSGYNYTDDIRRIRVEAGVSSIYEWAFAGMHNVATVMISGTVTEINEGAFEGCSKLASVTIPSNVIEIKGGVFRDCTSLHTVELSDGLEKLGNAVFENCTSLQNIQIPDTVREIGGFCFKGCTGLMSIHLPAALTFVEDDLFYDCSKLQSITIPENVITIGDRAFNQCDMLYSIVIPEGVTNIGERAFESCDKLASVTVPAGLENVGVSAFNSENLRSAGPAGEDYNIQLCAPEEIPAFMLSGCEYLERVVLPESVVSVGKCAFQNSNLSYLYVPASVESMGRGVFEAPNLTSAGPVGSECSIEFGWTEAIPDNAFAGASNLESVIIPKGISFIGDSAFLECGSLQAIVIPDSVRTIAEAAFSNCASLASAVLPKDLEIVDKYLFSDCTSLQKIVIPEGVQMIDILAFDGCEALTSVTLPAAVESIGNFAFRGCGLTDVYYGGTEEEKEAISFGRDNEPLRNAEWHFDGGSSAAVTSEQALLAALENPTCLEIVIAEDMEITESFLTIDKAVTIAEGVHVVYRPAPDPDSFFVKSMEIIDGGTLTVFGTLETQATFDSSGMTIAQIYVNGGSLDMRFGQASENCNFCFNAGSFLAPLAGFPDSVEVNRFFWEDANAALLAEAFAEDVLKGIILQTECTLDESVNIPDGKTLRVWDGGKLILNNGTLTGDVSVDGGEIILHSNTTLYGIDVPVWAAYTRITNNDDGSLSFVRYDDNNNPYNEEYIDFGNGSGMLNVMGHDGQTIWRESCDENGKVIFWVHYLQYYYGADDTWSVDYEAFTDGEHRIGTDYMSGSGDDMLQVAGVYVLDDGSTVREEYAADQTCMRMYFSAQGELTKVYRIAPAPDWTVEHIWDMTDGSILILPAGTREIGSKAFVGAAADKIVLPAGITALAEDAVSGDVLLLVPENFGLIDRLEACGFNYILVH